MKKIIVADTLKPLMEERAGVLFREGLLVLWAERADEIVSRHRKEKADLIVADLDMPGMSTAGPCVSMRSDKDLRDVSIIMICPDSASLIEKAWTCGANAVMVKPVDLAGLYSRIAEFLTIAARADMREIVGVDVELDLGRGQFFCVSRNISTSGMLLETGQILNCGDSITCSFVVNYPVAVPAEVVRKEGRSVGPYLYGLRFTCVDERSRSLIEEFVRGRSRPRETIT